jgi:hypothetical protein
MPGITFRDLPVAATIADANMFGFSGVITPENPNFSKIAGCLHGLPSQAVPLLAHHYQPHHSRCRVRRLG